MSKVTALSDLPKMRHANKAQLAEFFDVSVNTITQWVRRGCPVVKRGGPGKEWSFDALAVAEWHFGGGDQGDDTLEIDPEQLAPSDRKAWYESERVRRDLQERDRELIRVGEVEEVVATAFAACSQDIRAIPDRLERAVGITGEQAEYVEAQILACLDGLADRLQNLTPALGMDELEDGE